VLAIALARAPVAADEYRTPRAGEAASGTVFGTVVGTGERDRSGASELSVGGVILPDGPPGIVFSPQGGLYLWKVSDESRFRAILAVISNEVRWDKAIPRSGGFSLALTFDSLTLPWARSEYVYGVRIKAGELYWPAARAGVGLAFRTGLSPGACDNGFDAALTYEPGGLWFRRGPDTAPGYVLPVDTYEGRIHLRVRADALERNLLELPHEGWSAGLDGSLGFRARWEPWGFPAALETGGKNSRTLSAFAFAAFAPAPGLSERHRLIASVHAGTGSDLDRFSAFRIGGGTTWGDFETLSRLVLPGAGVDEFFAARYAIVDLEYRYEALFFLYLQLRGTLAWATAPPVADGNAPTGTGSYPGVTAGASTALPWNLVLELNGAYNFGLRRDANGRSKKGSPGILVSVTKVF
jgi:hypothetical protein